MMTGFASLFAQNYREQLALIRLQPDNSVVIGKISDYDGDKLSGAKISLFNPRSLSILQTIPVDDQGEYFFTIKKGQTLGFLIEKEGYFPYYHQLTVPVEAPEIIEQALQLPDGIRRTYILIYPPEGFIPVNGGILEELISLMMNQTELSLWMPDQQNPLGKSRIVFLDSLMLNRGIEPYRILSGSLPGNRDQIVEISFETDPDAQQISAYSEQPISRSGSDEKWTLQFSASKSKLPERDLRGLSDYEVFEGKDGYFRYTYGQYNSRQEANDAIIVLRNKGFNQAFPKLIGNLKKL